MLRIILIFVFPIHFLIATIAVGFLILLGKPSIESFFVFISFLSLEIFCTVQLMKSARGKKFPHHTTIAVAILCTIALLLVGNIKPDHSKFCIFVTLTSFFLSFSFCSYVISNKNAQSILNSIKFNQSIDSIGFKIYAIDKFAILFMCLFHAFTAWILCLIIIIPATMDTNFFMSLAMAFTIFALNFSSKVSFISIFLSGGDFDIYCSKNYYY